ncbi:MAG TPA: hypothetical protein LFW21_05350 [Rickettsia endosymbiont of Pyrocoelia pectoralis]|nr:hypothetical protein [Rickettsia endosymbiont of Pyrocoelia pectoralis]
MFRLLFICSVILLLYFGFTLMQSFDSRVFISLYNYDIETTFVFSIIAFLLLLVSCVIIVRFLILIIDLPIKIQNIFHNKKINNNRHSLVSAFAKYIIGDKAKAGSIARKNLSAKDLESEQEFYNLILAETEEDIDTKITYFQNLSKSREFAFYSNKNLAKLYCDKSLYQEAENYAIKAYNLNEYDVDNLITLIRCYGELSAWTKFTFIANKLAKLHKKKSISNSSEIAGYYLLAAKQETDSSNMSNALDHLESALEANFWSVELIEFYFKLNSNLSDSKKIKILKDAFRMMPSLELVKLFKKYTPLSDEQIYDELTKELNDEVLTLAISAYLNL